MGLITAYIKTMEEKLSSSLSKLPLMTNQAFARPTAAQIQQNQARADRKAAAIARRNDDFRTDAGFTAIYDQAVGA